MIFNSLSKLLKAMSIRIGLIVITIQLLFVLIESQIGSYPELNPTHCGLSRHSIDYSTEYHNKRVINEIRNGRNVTQGGAPWLVYILFMFQTSKIH